MKLLFSLLLLVILLVCFSLSSPVPTLVEPVEPDVQFDGRIKPYQTNFYKVTASARNTSHFEFTIFPCEGQVVWWIGPQGVISDVEDSRLIFYYDTSFQQNVYTDDIATITSVATFHMQDYTPGDYFVGIKNLQNITATFNGYFGLHNPYPEVGGDGHIEVDILTTSSLKLTWTASSTEGIEYCLYARQLIDVLDSYQMPGSACGVSDTNLIHCTTGTTFTFTNLQNHATYVFDITIKYLDIHLSQYVSAYNAAVVDVVQSSEYYTSSGSQIVFSLSVAALLAVFAF